VSVAKHGMNASRFSHAELKVRAIATRRANAQLLCVPWRRFRRAYEAYPRWQCLALWSRAVIATEGRVPSALLTTLQQFCPGFLEDGATSCRPELLAYRLLEWVHNQGFRYAKQQGWLDALTFYGVRHLRSEAAWAYGERCEHEWSTKPPTSLPTFEKWWREAMRWELCDGASCLTVASAIETYIDWEAFILWLRPLFATNSELPPQVVSELERRCPNHSRFFNSRIRENHENRSPILRRLARYGKNRFLSEAKKAGWLDFLLERVPSHPWRVRIMAYDKHWRKERPWSRALAYPSFHQWRQAAGQYIKAADQAKQSCRQ
jgi:hypothetical protein